MIWTARAEAIAWSMMVMRKAPRPRTGQNYSLFGQITCVTFSGSIARWDKQMRFLKVPAQQDHQPPVASKIDIPAIVSFIIVRIIMALLMTMIIQSDHCV